MNSKYSMNAMSRTTITISKQTKAELLREAAKLQLRLGRRVDLEDVILHLILESRKRAELLEEACKPVEGVTAEVVLRELLAERKRELEREKGTCGEASP